MGKRLLIGSITTLIIGLIVGFYFGQLQSKPTTETSTTTTSTETKQPIKMTPTTSARGVLSVEKPAEGEEVETPLLVTGSVQAKKGTVIIKLSQKESGVVVGEKKTTINGLSDKIQFAEAIQFGLPVIPQPGMLEVSFKDGSGKGLDDIVNLTINFPSDLGGP